MLRPLNNTLVSCILVQTSRLTPKGIAKSIVSACNRFTPNDTVLVKYVWRINVYTINHEKSYWTNRNVCFAVCAVDLRKSIFTFVNVPVVD